MSGVVQVEVAPDDGDVRLDRWFKRHYPQLNHGRLEKLLRTGQVRVDGTRAKANTRLQPGQMIRVPPLTPSVGSKEAVAQEKAQTAELSSRDIATLQAMVLYKDDDLIALNKPAGLAVQGGTGTTRHLDGMLDALRFGRDVKPRLVHRLDRDTSGVMIVARSAASARTLAKAFQSRDMEKVYWALVVGEPRYPAGTISAALAKTGPPGQEKMAWDDEEGKKAVTDYRVVATAGGKISWLALMPQTGRTHQIRAHCIVLGTPIVGDPKYTIVSPHVEQRMDLHEGILSEVADRLCLHSHSLTMPRSSGKPLTITAPLPAHMAAAFRQLGFDPKDEA
jgi:23S rRNA pseudouridine955/2504/2580 synthase